MCISPDDARCDLQDVQPLRAHKLCHLRGSAIGFANVGATRGGKRANHPTAPIVIYRVRKPCVFKSCVTSKVCE